MFSQTRTSFPVKCRPDYRFRNVIYDLKTTASANPDDFNRSIRDLRYFVQAAFYLEVARQHHPLIENFVFVAVESSPPYSAACYELNPIYLKIGKIQMVADLEKYVTAMRTGIKGYGTGVNYLEPDYWFVKKYIK